MFKPELGLVTVDKVESALYLPVAVPGTWYRENFKLFGSIIVLVLAVHPITGLHTS
jgi:hypothetical protein